MSVDTVDDLHAAEELAYALAHELRAAVKFLPPDAASAAGAVLARLNPYCRPTCGYAVDEECASGDTCGCPCEHQP